MSRRSKIKEVECPICPGGRALAECRQFGRKRKVQYLTDDELNDEDLEVYR